VDSTLSVQQGFPVATGDSVALAPAVADIDGDGSRDIVVFGRTKIYALSRAGASLDHFPLSVPNTTGLRTPLIGDVDGDGRVDIVGTSVDGLAFAYTRDGKTAPDSLSLSARASSLPRFLPLTARSSLPSRPETDRFRRGPREVMPAQSLPLSCHGRSMAEMRVMGRST